MKNEANAEMRDDCLRLIGCLGAIDSYYYKRILQKLAKSSAKGQNKVTNIHDIVNKTLKRKFIFLENLEKEAKLSNRVKI
jgi:FKBP12-rapamycin complex-associated protein